MKTKLILKGVLLYSTFLLAMLYVAGIDSIMDKGFDTFLFITGLVAGLIYLCYKKISEKERPAEKRRIILNLIKEYRNPLTS